MDKAKLLKIVNPALLISAVIQIITILFMFSGVLRSKAIFELHKYNGIVFVALILIHVYLNWGWIKGLFLKR